MSIEPISEQSLEEKMQSWADCPELLPDRGAEVPFVPAQSVGYLLSLSLYRHFLHRRCSLSRIASTIAGSLSSLPTGRCATHYLSLLSEHSLWVVYLSSFTETLQSLPISSPISALNLITVIHFRERAILIMRTIRILGEFDAEQEERIIQGVLQNALRWWIGQAIEVPLQA